MDIKKITEMVFPGPAGKKVRQDDGQGVDFQKLLREAQSPLPSKADAVQSLGQATGLETDPVFGLSPLTLSPGNGIEGSAPDRHEGTLALERTLDLLEQYQRVIADPNEGPDKIRPLIFSLSQRMNDMGRWEERLPSTDPLQKMLAEAEILSSVEITKFHRGDYV